MSGTRKVYMVGGGGHGKVILGVLQELGYHCEAVFDDNESSWGGSLKGAPIIGPVERLGCSIRRPTVIALGDNLLRRQIAERFPGIWLTIVHPSAQVDRSVSLGTGTVVLQRAVIQADARVGRHAIVNTAATIDHDCLLGDYVHVGPGSHLAGNVTIETGVFLGIGSVVVPGKRIGAWTTVGAGGVVTADLADKVLAIGVPARPRRILDTLVSRQFAASCGEQVARRVA